MARAKRRSLPFDRRGSRITLSTHMLKSKAYTSLMAQSKVLMTLMQMHWTNYKLVDYGIKEAAAKIPCDRRTAMKAFRQLQDRGFISCEKEFWFSSRTESRTRGWRLDWLPFNDRPPLNTWENWEDD